MGVGTRAREGARLSPELTNRKQTNEYTPDSVSMMTLTSSFHSVSISELKSSSRSVTPPPPLCPRCEKAAMPCMAPTGGIILPMREAPDHEVRLLRARGRAARFVVAHRINLAKLPPATLIRVAGCCMHSARYSAS